MNPRQSTALLVVAVLCLAFLEAYALYLGHNGTWFALTLTLIGSIAGVSVGKVWGAKNVKESQKGPEEGG